MFKSEHQHQWSGDPACVMKSTDRSFAAAPVHIIRGTGVGEFRTSDYRSGSTGPKDIGYDHCVPVPDRVFHRGLEMEQRFMVGERKLYITSSLMIKLHKTHNESIFFSEPQLLG
jgi:hypothetical protein